MIQLKNKVQSNLGHDYICCIEFKPNNDKQWSSNMVLKILETPASWYIEDTINYKHDKIYIDFGANWYVTGFQAVVSEVNELVNALTLLESYCNIKNMI